MLGVDHPVFKPRDGHRRFEGRARRILALQGAVEQGAIAVLQQVAITDGVDAFDEPVRFVAGLAHQRNDFAAAGVDGHHGAVEFAQRCLGDGLDVRVQRQVQVLPRLAGPVFDLAQGASEGIGFDDARAGHASQAIFVEALQAGLADLPQPLITGGIDTLKVVFGDAADVAHHMGAFRGQRIVAGEAGRHLGTAQVVAVDLEQGHFLHVQVGAQRHPAVARRAVDAVIEALEV